MLHQGIALKCELIVFLQTLLESLEYSSHSFLDVFSEQNAEHFFICHRKRSGT